MQSEDHSRNPSAKIDDFHRYRDEKFFVVSIKRLGATLVLPFWSRENSCAPTRAALSAERERNTGFFALSHIEITDMPAYRIYQRFRGLI